MKYLVLFLLGCPPSSSGVTPNTVYSELVEAGCLAPTSDGVAAITQEHAAHDTPWVECLFDAGTIKTCQVPCQ